MSWDANKPSLLNWTRLMSMSADSVYGELKKYGHYQDADKLHFSYNYDENLEKALLGRNDPLINLGIAEFGGSDKVALNIWQRTITDNKNDQYRKGIRLALLRNPHHLRRLLPGAYGFVPMEDLQKIVDSDDGDEIAAILTNPAAKSLLSKFLNRQPPFHALDERKFLSMIYFILKSPALTHNDDNEHGPDLDSMHIQQGIVKLLETFPVSEDSIEAFHWLLSTINPEQVAYPHSDPRAMFKRWQDFKVGEKFAERFAERMGRYTGMDFKDEFVCLMASLYGVYFSASKAINLGSLDDPDPVMRYCHYGRTTMKPEDMQKAWNKDQEAFTFAVLHGYSVTTDQQRAVIESHLRGIHQIRLYYKRIANSRWRKRDQDAPVRAVTQDGQELLENLSEYPYKPDQDELRLQRIEQQIPVLALQNARTLKYLQWTIALLIVTVVLLFKRGW